MTIDAPTSSSSLSPPARAARIPYPVRLCMGLTYALALAIAIALPHAGIAPLLSIFAPLTAMAITVAVTQPRGGRRAAWSAVGWRWPGLRMLAISLLLPAAILAASFGGAGLLGVATFPDLHVSGRGLDAHPDLGLARSPALSPGS